MTYRDTPYLHKDISLRVEYFLHRAKEGYRERVREREGKRERDGKREQKGKRDRDGE